MAATTASAINTGKVTDRRKLHFNSPADLRADVERIVAAERAGKLRRTGNWTTGQIFGHVAAFIDYAYDGYPPKLANAPWFIRFILYFFKSKFLRGPLPAGRRIPGIPSGTTGNEPLTLEDGYARLIRAWDRLEKTAPQTPNVIFGRMTHNEWITLHLRHAELHLSFLHP